MGIAVNLDKDFVNSARSYSTVQRRSVAKQIEHWAIIGRIAEENPDLNYSIINNILLGIDDLHHGRVEPYDPSKL